MKKESIKRGSVVISVLNVVARALGFISVFLVSYYFGANSNTDLYYYLTSFTALISILFICLQPTVLMPLFIKTKIQSGEKKAWLFVNSLFTYTLLAIVAFSLLFFNFSDKILAKFSHFSEVQIINSRNIIILFAPIIVLTVISEFLRSLIQAHNQYTFPSVILLVSNIFMIFGLVIGAKKIGVLSMSIAVIISLLFQCLFLLLYIKKSNPQFGLSLKYTIEIKQFILLSFPVLFAQIFASGSMFYYDYTSTIFTAGTLTAISFSQKIFTLPADMIVTPMSNVLSPLFSEHNARKEFGKLTTDYIKYNGIIWYCVIPISVFFIFYSDTIIQLLFFRGNFTKENVATASLSLKTFSISLFGISYVSIYTRVLYSIQKTKLISLQAIIISLASIFLTYFLSLQIGYLGIPLTRTLSILLLSFPQGIYLSYKYLSDFSAKKIFISFITITVSALTSALLSLIIYNKLLLQFYIDNHTLLLFINLSISFFIFIIFYLLASIIIKTHEGIYLYNILKDKIEILNIPYSKKN